MKLLTALAMLLPRSHRSKPQPSMAPRPDEDHLRRSEGRRFEGRKKAEIIGYDRDGLPIYGRFVNRRPVR